MRKLFAALFSLLWLSALPLTAAARDAADKVEFRPAQAVSVDDVTRPVFSPAYGTLLLDLMVSAKGEVGNVQVRRDLGPLTEVAVRSVRGWKFEPAKISGHAVSSRVTVAVTLNPPCALPANVPLPPLIHQRDEARIQSRFQPPEVTAALFASYPAGALNPGTVVIEATVSSAGTTEGLKVMRDVPPFTGKAIQAARNWRFMPATFDGRSLRSKAILAFLFGPLPPAP